MAELGAGSGTGYPGALDTDNTQETNSPAAGKTKARAEVINDLNAAVVALQTELGTDPAGSLTDVKTNLQTEHSADGTHSDITPDSIVAGGIVTWKKGADIASATALPMTSAGNYRDVTGTTTVTSIDTVGVGTVVKLHFDGALILTHHATDLVLPTGANITTVAGDEAEFVEYATGDWRCTNYSKVDGSSVYAGRVVQVAYSQSSTMDTSATDIPNDNSAPLWDEGETVAALDVAITPTNSSNILHIDVRMCLANNAANRMALVALFQDASGTDPAIAAIQTYPNDAVANVMVPTMLRYSMAAGTTSSTTFSIRYGGANGAGSTVTLNGINGGAWFGGVCYSSVTITEVMA